MKYSYNKPIIASYTEIAAMLCVIQNNSYSTMMWQYELYSNLCWEMQSNVLYHCGKYDHYSYMEFEDENRIILYKLPKQASCEELKEYMDKDFSILLPINTKILGITNSPYKHNVFIVGYEDENFFVYDFWSPSFVWKCKSINCNELFLSIDFTNSETVQSFYLFKENTQFYSKMDEDMNVNIKSLHSTLLVNLNKEKNKNYNYKNAVYGLDVYSTLCNYMDSINTFNLVDCQNFHVLLDHLSFNKYCFQVLLKNNLYIQNLLKIYDDLIDKIVKIRTYAYKYYVSKRDISKIRNMIIEHLQYICENERNISHKLLDIVNDNLNSSIINMGKNIQF